MTVYIDSNFACHLTDDGSMTAVEVDMFDGKCPEFIEAYRCVPQGQTWIRPDGMRFEGMLSPNLYIPFLNTELVLNWVVYLIFAA